MDLEEDDSKTLRLGLLLESKEQNSTYTIDCTAMEVTWLSKRQHGKRVGSLVVWLRQLAAAEHLIQQGTALFGASGCTALILYDGTALNYATIVTGTGINRSPVPIRRGAVYPPIRTTRGTAVRGLRLDVQHEQGNTLSSIVLLTLIGDAGATRYASQRLRS